MRPLTENEKKEYDRLTADAKQIEFRLDELVNRPVVYGYARVSSRGQARDGNSLEAQETALKAAGAEYVYSDAYTGTTTDRPQLDKLLAELKAGDTLIVTKMDRIARSVQQGISLIDELAERGVMINILNMGIIDNSSTGKLIRNIMLSFAEYERDMIMARTREGKEIARQAAGYKEGRPPKYSKAQFDHAMDLLETYSYSQVTRMTGISKATLARERAKRAKYQ